MSSVSTPMITCWGAAAARRAAVNAPTAPIKEMPQIVVPCDEPQMEVPQTEVKPVKLVEKFEEASSNDGGFEVVGMKGYAANQARMERQAAKALAPKAPYVKRPVVEVRKREIVPLRANPVGPSRETILQTIKQKLDQEAPVAAAAATVAPVVPKEHTSDVAFKGKETVGLTFFRLHKQTKADLKEAMEVLYNQCIEAMEHALQTNNRLQNIEHMTPDFQTRVSVDGASITVGDHTFKTSDICSDAFWVRKTRKTLNQIEGRLRVSFYFDYANTKVVMALKKATW